MFWLWFWGAVVSFMLTVNGQHQHEPCEPRYQLGVKPTFSHMQHLRTKSENAIVTHSSTFSPPFIRSDSQGRLSPTVTVMIQSHTRSHLSNHHIDRDTLVPRRETFPNDMWPFFLTCIRNDAARIITLRLTTTAENDKNNRPDRAARSQTLAAGRLLVNVFFFFSNSNCLFLICREECLLAPLQNSLRKCLNGQTCCDPDMVFSLDRADDQ